MRHDQNQPIVQIHKGTFELKVGNTLVGFASRAGPMNVFGGSIEFWAMLKTEAGKFPTNSNDSSILRFVTAKDGNGVALPGFSKLSDFKAFVCGKLGADVEVHFHVHAVASFTETCNPS